MPRKDPSALDERPHVGTVHGAVEEVGVHSVALHGDPRDDLKGRLFWMGRQR